jgi:GTPase SAR1 family protein
MQNDGVQILSATTGLRRHTIPSAGGDLAWSPDSKQLLVTSLEDIGLYASPRWKRVKARPDPRELPFAASWHPLFNCVAIGSSQGSLEVWTSQSWESQWRSDMRKGSIIQLAWHPRTFTLAAAAVKGVSIYDGKSGVLVRELEQHVAPVAGVAFSADGALLATASDDGLVCLWETSGFDIVGEIREPGMDSHRTHYASVAFHPMEPWLATRTAGAEKINVWVYGNETKALSTISQEAVQYTNAKIVLVGDTGVGKSGLALALTGQSFAPTESTHARRVWPFISEQVETSSGTHQAREALLWDLAGQPGYRLIHQLHLGEAMAALIVFDSRSELDPFAGVRYWDRALRQAQRLRPDLLLTKFLVAARIDRGVLGVSRERIEALVKELKFDGYFETSAKDGTGVFEVGRAMREAINWDTLPIVSSNRVFQGIKNFLLDVKQGGTLLISLDQLYRQYAGRYQLKTEDQRGEFDVCVGRMESRDLIRRLSFGGLLLLQPELLDAYASALVNAAREEPDGLGHIPQEIALAGRFRLAEEERIREKDQEQLLLIATVEELLRHEIVLREQTDAGPYLVFPSQFTREHPDSPDPQNKAVTFTFEGAIVNIYSTLIVRLTHTGFFAKDAMWKNAATFRSTGGHGCGLSFREIGEGRAELNLSFDSETSDDTRLQFEQYIKSHLERRAVSGTLARRRIFVCSSCSTPISDLQATRRRERGEDSITCNVCDNHVSLLDTGEKSKIAEKLIARMDRQADAKRNLETAAAVLRGKEETKDFDVFLAHSSKDKSAVEQIADDLRTRGINPWLDKEQVPPGRWFQDVIQEAIPHVRSAAIIIGPDGLGQWEAVELRAFISRCVEKRLPVIPVLLPGADGFPHDLIFLRELNAVQFMTLRDLEALKRLVWGITGKNPFFSSSAEVV